MSLSINESIDLQFQCKGNWIAIAHYVFPNKPMKINEKFGYCPICWQNDFKSNNYSSRNYIKTTFKQCASDSL